MGEQVMVAASFIFICVFVDLKHGSVAGMQNAKKIWIWLVINNFNAAWSNISS